MTGYRVNPEIGYISPGTNVYPINGFSFLPIPIIYYPSFTRRSLHTRNSIFHEGHPRRRASVFPAVRTVGVRTPARLRERLGQVEGGGRRCLRGRGHRRCLRESISYYAGKVQEVVMLSPTDLQGDVCGLICTSFCCMCFSLVDLYCNTIHKFKSTETCIGPELSPCTPMKSSHKDAIINGLTVVLSRYIVNTWRTCTRVFMRCRQSSLDIHAVVGARSHVLCMMASSLGSIEIRFWRVNFMLAIILGEPLLGYRSPLGYLMYYTTYRCFFLPYTKVQFVCVENPTSLWLRDDRDVLSRRLQPWMVNLFFQHSLCSPPLR